MIYGHWHNHYYKQLKSGLHTYCSSTPDKGGIDHGTSCFRIYNADTKGKLSSATRYTYIDGILTSAYPAEGETVSVPDGKNDGPDQCLPYYIGCEEGDSFC